MLQRRFDCSGESSLGELVWRAVPLLTPVLLEGRASLLFIVNLVLVVVLGRVVWFYY